MDKRDAKFPASGSDKCPNHPLGGSHSFVRCKSVVSYPASMVPAFTCPGCGKIAFGAPRTPAVTIQEIPTLEDEMDAGEALADGLDYPDLED